MVLLKLFLDKPFINFYKQKRGTEKFLFFVYKNENYN